MEEKKDQGTGGVMPVQSQNQTTDCKQSPSWLKWALVFLPLAYLWFRLIGNLYLEWDSNPQYSYGLVVPLLVAGLLLRRWHSAMKPSAVAEPDGKTFAFLFFAGIAFLYLPTRLVEAATPEWRPIEWMLGVEAVGLTLLTIYFAKGKKCLAQLAFPICFFFVSIPWPTLFETPIIQTFSRLNASMVVEVVGVLGVPALQHGNIIEVSTGSVGINDACSGIRSFQSSLMISLFLGEFYFLSWPRRILLVPAGFIIAMFFNLCRTSLLTMIAAKKGVDAIATYHDEAGVTIMLACTLTLWIAALLLAFRRRVPANNEDEKSVVGGTQNKFAPDWHFLKRLAVALIVWLAVVEIGVELWYRIRESHIQPGPAWAVNLPTDDLTYKDVPVTPDENILLRFDDCKQGQWQDTNGIGWQVYYFNWLPGRVAGYLAKRHTPDICLPATGMKMTSGPTLMPLEINGIKLPMRAYVFEGGAGPPVYVYQCHWDPAAGQSSYADESSRFNLIRGIWAGRGNKGQKVVEVIVSGYDNPDSVREPLIQQLGKIIQVQKP